MILSATVNVEPLPKSRPRFGGGRAYTDSKTSQYEKLIGWSLRPHVKKRNDVDDLKVTLQIRTKTRQRKDIDNLVKSIFDACNQIVWADDQQVTELHATLSRGSDSPGFDILVEVAEHRSRFCKKCGKSLTKVQSSFCSKDCYDTEQRKGTYRACKGCGSPVYRQNEKSKAIDSYCSHECRWGRTAKCRNCGSEIKGHAKFCGLECSASWYKDRPLKSKLGGKCMDCGKEIARSAKRCRHCYFVSRRSQSKTAKKQ